MRKLTCSVSFKFLKLEKIFHPLFEALSLDWVFLLQLVYLLLTDKLDQFVLDLMHKTQKLCVEGNKENYFHVFLHIKLKKKKKNALYLNVHVFSTKVLIGDTIFTSPAGDGTAILRGHPNHAKM